MAQPEIHQGNIGTVFRFEITNQDDAIVDVSGASVREIFFQKPDLTSFTKFAAFVTDGTDGQLEYTSLTGDLDAFGQWYRQVHVVIPAGEFFSEWIPFIVHRNIA